MCVCVYVFCSAVVGHAAHAYRYPVVVHSLHGQVALLHQRHPRLPWPTSVPLLVPLPALPLLVALPLVAALPLLPMLMSLQTRTGCGGCRAQLLGWAGLLRLRP